ARESRTQRAVERSLRMMDAVLKVRASRGLPIDALDVGDIGCNTGTQSSVWAEHGHRVQGVDINEGLIEIARQRAAESGHAISFSLGSATELPWPSESLDICLLPELLEHVPDWKRCIAEAVRVLRPRGT